MMSYAPMQQPFVDAVMNCVRDSDVITESQLFSVQFYLRRHSISVFITVTDLLVVLFTE